MQFITTDQRIAVENFEIGLIYTVTFTSGSYFLGACIGIGKDYVMFQRTAPKLVFSLTMAAAADVASIEPLPADIGQILEYTGTVPVSIKTDGSPLLDYLITGNTIQNGTPTPDSPIMPQGTGERSINILNPESKSTNQQGAERWGGVFPAGTYYVLNNSIDNVYYRDGVSSTSSTAIIPNRGAVITTTNELVVWHGSKTEDIMVAVSSTALPYEPYGYKIPILSNSTTTNVYLGEVQTTRQIRKIDLGTLNWTKTASGNFWAATAISNIRTIGNAATGNAICDMFKEVTSNAVANEPYSFSSCLNTVGRPFINRTGFEDLTAEKFKEAMSGVYMYYVLATEETAVVNEPLMRIGGYADTLSYRQSGVNIPTTDGLNIFDIDTTVKPSEVYLKYFSPLL